MNCPSCNLPVPGNNLSTALRAGRCASCDALFDLDGGGHLVQRARSQVAALSVPRGWAVEELSGRFAVRWRWFSVALVFLLPFAVVWNGMLVGLALSTLGDDTPPEYLLIGLALPHTWVGVGLAYFVLASFVNTTTVSLAEGKLSVHHGPLWWPGRTSLARGDVQQLFVVEQRAKNSVTYQVCALLRDGTRRVLVRSLRDEAAARYLEVRLEGLLGLADQPVAGEVRKG